MLTQANIQVIFFSLPIYQLLFFTIQLISFRKTNPARKYLGLLLMGMTAFLIINVLYYSDNSTLMVWLYIFFIPIFLTLPPNLYLYITSLVKEMDHTSKFSKFVLFIPPLVILILNLTTFGIIPISKRVLFLSSNLSVSGNSLQSVDYRTSILWIGVGLLLLVQLVLAIFKTTSLLRNEKAIIIKRPSYLAYLNFKWVYILALSLLVFMLASAIQILFVSAHTVTSSVIFNLIILLSSGLAGYYGMKQDSLFTQVSRVGIRNTSSKEKAGSNHFVQVAAEANKALITEDEAKALVLKIEAHLALEKPYLDKRFTISDLSKQTGISRNKLAYLINEVMDKNFLGLINDYRVHEAMNIMKTSQNNPTIDAIADMAGFHSRSSFYACFKKYTGLTPKEFMSKKKMV